MQIYLQKNNTKCFILHKVLSNQIEYVCAAPKTSKSYSEENQATCGLFIKNFL